MTKRTVGLVSIWIALAVVPAGAAEDEAAEATTAEEKAVEEKVAEVNDGPAWTWFGTLRMRPEYSEDLSDLTSGSDDKIAYVSYRAKLGVKVDLPNDVGVLFDGQVVGLWGEDQTPFHAGLTLDTSTAKYNFFQAYAEARDVFETDIDVRAGRQTLVFGDEWLMGDADFYGGTSFDALRGDFGLREGQLAFFWAKIAETNSPEAIATSPDVGGDSDLYGTWLNYDLGHANRLDAALVYLLDHRVLSSSTIPFQDKRWTLTAQFQHGGDMTGAFVRANTAIQWGTTLTSSGLAETDISEALAAEVTGGYTWEINEGLYKLFGRLARYTGDAGGTEDSERFEPLFQDTHNRYGYLDMWNGQWGFTQFLGGDPGFRALQIGFEATLPNHLRVAGYAQQLKRDTQISSTEGNKDLGEEFGVSAAYDYGENVTIEAATAILHAGTGLERGVSPTFTATTPRRVYVNTVVRF